jgi:hypothetical protein
MDDSKIEELLRESWQPEPPDGMRDRVMGRAQHELNRRTLRFPRISIPRWQAGLAVACLVLLLACGISDSARESRIASLESSNAPRIRVLMAQRPLTLGEGRAQLYRLLRDPSSDLIVP